MLYKIKKMLGIHSDAQLANKKGTGHLIHDEIVVGSMASHYLPLCEAESFSLFSSHSKEINQLFNAWLRGATDAQDGRPELGIEEQIVAEAQKLSASTRQVGHLVRRMPGVIPQLMQHLRSENYSGADIAKKMRNDVALLAAVLRLANSAQYNCKHKITSMQQAILLIGQDGLRQLITSVAFRPIVNSQSGRLFRIAAPRLWEQSEKCAIANRFLALENGIDHFPVFLAGLIKNVGLNILMRMADTRLLENQHIGTPEFWDAMNHHSSILTSRIAREWHFPEEVINAIDETRHSASVGQGSALGTLLKHGDALSKLQILTENDFPGVQDITDSWNMTELEHMCLHEVQNKSVSSL